MKVKNPHLLPPTLGGQRIARLARFGAAITLSLFTVAVNTSAQKGKPGPALAAGTVSSDWVRMMEGLKKARPVPQETNRPRSTAITSSGDLVRFDALTGQVSRLAAAKVEANSLAVSREEGNPGTVPEPADGNSRVILGDGPEALGATGSADKSVVPFDIVPTPPRPLLQPYIFQPYKTGFRLLMRFFVAGFGDRFYICSASSASSFHLISAGHCVYNHDPLGDKSGRGAGYAAEIWAWPAATDFADPINPDEWPDFPWGIAKMTRMATYDGWINSSDWNWDLSFITLDRRIGDHVGWMGREWGVNATTLFYTGYPVEEPYVPSNNPYQYPGADNGNVKAYTCCRIQMNALTYGGHSGGAIFRCCNNSNYVFEGVNSTSNRAGDAEATLFTARNNADLTTIINVDRSARPPVDRAQLIEYLFDNNSKGLFDTSVALGLPFAFKINAFNAGYIPARDVTADIYLTESLDVDAGTYIGTIHLGDLNANQFLVWNTGLVLPTYVQPGNYFLAWKLSTQDDQYFTDQINALITKDVLRVVGLSAVLTNPNAVAGGTSTTGTVQLTGPAPPNGLGHGIDVLLSSDNAAAQFINFVHINEGATSGTFNITTSRVTQNTTAVITAKLNGITRATSILIKPPAALVLNSVALAPSSVLGGNNSTATVSLSGPAPAGGITVNLTSSNAKAVVPPSVKVNAGSASATFTVKTISVTAAATASIKATFSGVSKAATLSIGPVQTAAITLSPSTLKGGAKSVATITLNGPAPAGGATVSLASSNTHAKVAATVKVNAGISSVTVTVNTTAVTANTTASIKATAGGVSKSASLTIQH